MNQSSRIMRQQKIHGDHIKTIWKPQRSQDLRLLSGRWLSPSMADLNGSSSLPAAWQRLAEEALAEAAAERTWTAWSSEGDVSLV